MASLPWTKVWRSGGSNATTINSYDPSTAAMATVVNFFQSGSSIFEHGRLEPGIYKIRNIVSKTYVDIKDDARQLCGRPSTALEDGRGQVRPHKTVDRECS